MLRRLLHLAAVVLPLSVSAQTVSFSQPHGFCSQPFTLTITADDVPEGAALRYTTDCGEPSLSSKAFAGPIAIGTTTVVRAAVVADTGLVTPIATATYLFVDDVLSQSNHPDGYPSEWGRYTDIQGTAVADYEMDPEMTRDPELRSKIAEGLQSLPVVSIVTAKDNLFSHENDPDRGGIYIFTGPPVGDATGHGWTRQASVEMFGRGGGEGPVAQPDLSTTCGLRLHGGHGRLAEKNPKHSLRLVFKEKYGPKTLQYPLFGDDEPQKFDQLVLRCHFGNSWQHWGESNRQKAQYARDVWTRRMQRRLGRTSINALYVNLFINGMYWGLYNLSERVDDQFGKDHLGGKKSDIDVVKIEEDGGNHHEAAEGDLTAWKEMLSVVEHADDDACYARLDTLLDVGSFIDYMLINHYAGNGDWDHHNWYAIRRRGQDSEGFRFLCWDSEIVFEDPNTSVLATINRGGYPTGIFHSLLRNEQFARSYLRRAKELLADDGPLGQQSVVELWDSLYHTIETAVYAEAARWGDYRRDVHRWQTPGQLYTVDNQFMAERQRLLTQYFPVRTEKVLADIVRFVGIDDFEAPADWTRLTPQMFHEWNGTGANAQPTDAAVSVDWQMGVDVGGGGAIAGFVGVEENHYADVSDYAQMVLRGSGNGVRILANRLVAHGPWKQIVVSFSDRDPYWDASLQAVVLPLSDLQEVATNEGKTRHDDFVHLNAIKVDWNSTARVSSIWLTSKSGLTAVDTQTAASRPNDGHYYNLSGQRVARPTKGIYIYNGRKVLLR